MTQDELKDRTKRFALRIINLVEKLPSNTTGRTLGHQLVRCGTSVGANYRSACRRRSKAEFIAKLGIVLEEADESGFWLELIIEGNVINANRVSPLLAEANELTAIFASTINSLKDRKK